jgi:periplasmic copper chaperone A
VTDRVSPRRTLTVAALVAVLPIAAACSAGKGNETRKEHATPYIAQARVGNLLVTNAAIVPSGSTTTVGASQGTSTSSVSSGTPSSGADGYLLVTIANSGTAGDTLTGVSISTAQVTPADGSTSGLDIAPRSVVQFGDPELGSSGPALRVSNVQTPVNVGQSVSVTFTFQNAGSATVSVPVRASDDLGTTSSSAPLTFTGSYPSPTESVPAPESSPEVSTTSSP